MKKSRASLRYAKSILSFSEENNTSKKVALDMQKLSDLMQVNSDLQTALENPLIANEKKLMILNGLFPDTSESTKKLFSLMADNNRLAILAQSCYHFLELYAISNKITKATVTSVSPLSSDLKDIVYKKTKTFSKGELKIENKIDPNIIGGFILKIGDMQLDASITSQLKTIKTKLTKVNTI
jgi:F-type H+-transporting ATPase subunit delta